jgi:hypothetical protein
MRRAPAAMAHETDARSASVLDSALFEMGCQTVRCWKLLSVWTSVWVACLACAEDDVPTLGGGTDPNAPVWLWNIPEVTSDRQPRVRDSMDPGKPDASGTPDGPPQNAVPIDFVRCETFEQKIGEHLIEALFSNPPRTVARRRRRDRRRRGGARARNAR